MMEKRRPEKELRIVSRTILDRKYTEHGYSLDAALGVRVGRKVWKVQN
jgi:hypothetical protein